MGEGQWREGGGRRQFGLKGKRGGTREGGRERLGTGTLFHLAKFVSNEYKKKKNNMKIIPKCNMGTSVQFQSAKVLRYKTV